MDQNLSKEQVSIMLDEKIESLYIKLSLGFKQELYRAIDFLRGTDGGQTFNNVQYL